MKRTLTLILAVVMLATMFIIPVNAANEKDLVIGGTNVEIEYLENGDYIVTYIETSSIIVPDASTQATTVTKTKTKNYLNSAGDVMWCIKVQGTFTYDGSTSKCTNAAHKAASYAASWSIVSASSSKSGNTATAKATARHTAGAGYNDYTKSVTLTCSKTGVFS